MNDLSTQERIDLIMSVGDPANGGEVVGAEELPKILESGEPLFTYDGFEPSGQMHIAQGIIRAINTNKMIKAGFTFKMWVADWFGYLNNKMGGDLEQRLELFRRAPSLNGIFHFMDMRDYWDI